MEKKNTLILTVTAIATLMAVAVGATFAYFTATQYNFNVKVPKHFFYGEFYKSVSTKVLTSAN